jgi:hypothetical protein
MALSFDLYLDPYRNVAYRDFNDLTFADPLNFFEASKVKINLYLVKTTGSAAYPMENVTAPTAANTSLRLGTPGTANIYSVAGAALSAPTITVSSTSSGNIYFGINNKPVYGTFNISYSGSTPALSFTTAAIQFPFTSADVQNAIITAINAQAGWSGAKAVLTQQGDTTGYLTISAINSTVTYNLQTAGGTLVFNTFLTSFPGISFSVDLTAGGTVSAINTLLGTDTSVGSFVEFTDTTATAETYGILPCVLSARIL